MHPIKWKIKTCLIFWGDVSDLQIFVLNDVLPSSNSQKYFKQSKGNTLATVSSDIKKDLAKQNLFQASAIRLSKRFADVSRTQSRKSAQYNLVKMHIHVRTKK